MSREIIQIGATVNDPTGDTLRASFEKTNANFSDLYARLALVESLNLPSRLPQGAEASGAPRRLVPTSGGRVVASHAVIGSLDSAASMATFSSFAIARLSPTLALVVHRANSGIPAGERENTNDPSYNLSIQIVKIAVDGTPTFGPRKLVALSNSATSLNIVSVSGVARLDGHRAVVAAYSSGGSNQTAAWLVDYDVAADTLAVTRSSNAPIYRVGNNTHLAVTSDGMVVLPESGGIDLLAQTLSGPTAGLVSALTSPATDALGGDTFVSAGGSSVPGVAGLRLTLCLYKIVRGFPQLIDRLVTPHAFTSGASVYALSSDSAVVSWLQASGSRAGGLVTIANGRISLASWTPNGVLGATPWGCLPISPTRFLALVQTNNAGISPASGGNYVWRAIELVDGVLVEREQFAAVYNVSGQTSGLHGLDAVILDADRVLLAGVAGNGAIAVKTVRFG